MIEYENGALGDPGLPEPEPHERPWERITWPVKGVVVNVIPPDSPQNGQGQLLCDVRLIDDGYTVFNVTVLSSLFHQDTDPEAPLARQTIPARARNIFDGESFCPQVGSIALIQFIGPPGPNRDAAIIGFFPVSMQSLPHAGRTAKDNLFPREVQAVTVFDENGVPAEEFRARMHAMESESPRWTRVQNGTAVEIDNRGNFNVQTTINRERIKKERYSNFDYSRAEIKETPEPEGNAVISTRGAKKGNIGLFTGKLNISELKQTLFVIEDGQERAIELRVREPVDEENEEGNIVASTVGAKKGNVHLSTGGEGDIDIETLAATSGKVSMHTGGQGDVSIDSRAGSGGTLTVRTGGKGKVKIDSRAGSHGDQSYIVGDGRVSLGADHAQEAAVLGNSLLQWIVTVLMTHIHFGVQNGNSVTGPPNITPPDMLSESVYVSRSGAGTAPADGGDDPIPPTPGGSQSGSTSVEQSATNLAAAFAGIIINDSNLDKMAVAITQFEGYFSGSRSQRNNNPGNLVYKRQPGAIGKDSDGFAKFGTFEQGFGALKGQLTSAASGSSAIYKPTMTLVDFFQRYDPTSSPVAYADHVAKNLNVSRNITIGELLG